MVTISDTVPSASQIIAGQNQTSAAAVRAGSQLVNAAGVQSITITTGLTASTVYYMHLTQEDAVGNFATVLTSAAFTTNQAAVQTPSSSSGGSSGGGGSSSRNSNSGSNEIAAITPDSATSTPSATVQTTLPAIGLFRNNISYLQPQLNVPSDVRNLETFLNEFEGESLTVDGIYGTQDNEAMKRFQRKYAREILDVWNLTDATGYVGITTRLKLNFLLKGQTSQCPVFTEYNGGLDGVYTSEEIRKTKQILADLAMYSGPIDSIWTPQTHEALIVFQETFREVMLDPWNITEGTGYKYKTTNKFLNYFVGCDTGSVFLEGIGEYEGL